MAAWAPAARVEAARPRSRPAPRPQPRAARVAERRVAGGVVWIVLLGVLLTGVVALNVAVLRLNMQLEQLGRERVELRAENALLTSQLSSATAPRRVEALARARLGLVPAQDPAYVELGRAR